LSVSAAGWLEAEPAPRPATPSAPASFKLSLRESMRVPRSLAPCRSVAQPLGVAIAFKRAGQCGRKNRAEK
jgi:hypothetical protein